MSGVVDVGDPFKLTFESLAGALVTVTWLDPDLQPVFEDQVVPPESTGSEKYPKTLVATRPGMWTAVFTDSAGASEAYYVRATLVVGLKPPLAAVGDVTAQYGELDPDQESLTRYLLKAASGLIRGRFPLVDEQIVSGKLDADVVALQAANMVLRVLRNPEGLRSKTEGPFTVGYDTSVAAGLLVIGDDEDDALTPPVASATGGLRTAGTIRAVPGMMPGRSGWW